MHKGMKGSLRSKQLKIQIRSVHEESVVEPWAVEVYLEVDSKSFSAFRLTIITRKVCFLGKPEFVIQKVSLFEKTNCGCLNLNVYSRLLSEQIKEQFGDDMHTVESKFNMKISNVQLFLANYKA